MACGRFSAPAAPITTPIAAATAHAKKAFCYATTALHVDAFLTCKRRSKLELKARPPIPSGLVAMRPAASHYRHTTTTTEAYRFFLPPFFFLADVFFFFFVPPPPDDTLIRFGTLPLFARTLAARAAAASSNL